MEGAVRGGAREEVGQCAATADSERGLLEERRQPFSTHTQHITTFAFPPATMRQLLGLALLVQGSLACISTNPRQAQFSAPTQQFQAPPAPPQQQVFVARAAAANRGPNVPLSTQNSVLERMLGKNVQLSEFSADGYNSEGGGPVNAGQALSCYNDGRPCCWANVPPPDDQLDWQVATGKPEAEHFRNVPAPEGSYLVAYARAAAPSDEAQFASCSIGCASSPITVRAKHWQSENVLLQVCQRESFPNSVNFNPLLNCQEFPLVNGLATTELVLPKASLVDIVFVASNFVGENGDMAILDDIEISYDHSGPECNKVEESTATHRGESRETTIDEGKNSELFEKTVAGQRGAHGARTHAGVGAEEEAAAEHFESRSGVERFGEENFQGGMQLRQTKKHGDTDVIESTKSRALGSQTAKGVGSKDFSMSICNTTKCNFEDGTTCQYKDAHQTQSIRGLTTKFQVVTGQFMNRVTGVKESSEGDFYAATFLFPREMAGLEATTEPFTETSRLRFRYYEGTHGVQLKGCCDSLESCPFSSDKFVSVADRVWKTASFKCPQGTEKVIFVCENTRTNQGACAIDDMGMVEEKGHLATVKALC